MARILLADDSPHAQRMGVRILREEGFEVVSVTDGATAVVRMADVDPDVVIADVFLPGKSGIDLCRYIKNDSRYRRARMVLAAGLLEQFSEQDARGAGCDAILRKPFEASALVRTVRDLIEQAEKQPVESVAEPVVSEPAQVVAEPAPVAAEPETVVPEPETVAAPPEPVIAEPEPAPAPVAAAPPVAPVPSRPDPERVRAAVTLALDAALPELINEITDRVLIALRQ